MMATEKYTTVEVVEALRAARGIKTHAAQTLGCDRLTVDNYIKRHPTVAKAYQELREAMVDQAERGLIHLLDAEDWQAIKYTLSTLGKDRGYIERQEVTGPDGTALQVEYVNDWRTYTPPVPPPGPDSG